MIVVNAKDFNLVDGKHELQHKAIQDAIDHCYIKGGGEVIIPKGEYTVGDIRLRSNITLKLEAGCHLMGSRNPEDYFNYLNDTIEPFPDEEITDCPYVHWYERPNETHFAPHDPIYNYRRCCGSRWNNGLIRAYNAKNIKIIGERDSVIDGMNCYDAQGEEKYRGPHGITLFHCEDVELQGYTIQQTGNWAHWIAFSKNINVNAVQVIAGHDGIDIFDCINTSITNCEFYTGDDCIAGIGNINTYVNKCILNTDCSAMRFGGTNAYIENCNAFGPAKYSFRGKMSQEDKEKGVSSPKSAKTEMASFFTYYADFTMPIPATPSNIIIDNCYFEKAAHFIHYNFSGNEPWQKYKPLSNITFSNIRATDITAPSNLYGTPDEKITLNLKNISASVKDSSEAIDFIHACNYEEINIENVKVNGKIKSFIRKWSDGKINIYQLDCDCDSQTETSINQFSTNPI